MDGIEEMSNQGTTLKNHLPKAQKKESKVVVLIGLDLLVCRMTELYGPKIM